jgi:hypothetical protein
VRPDPFRRIAGFEKKAPIFGSTSRVKPSGCLAMEIKAAPRPSTSETPHGSTGSMFSLERDPAGAEIEPLVTMGSKH